MREKRDIVLVTGDKKPPGIPVVKTAAGNVPMSDEFNALVEAFNALVLQLREQGVIK